MTSFTREVTYRVRSTDGQLVDTVAELRTPSDAPPVEGWPVVVYGHGTSGLGPSVFAPMAPRPAEEEVYLESLVAQGWAVVAPTYLFVGEPPVHTYLDGPDEARAMIGALHAARRVEPGLGRRWISHGGSQGGHAALWAASFMPTLGRDLQFAGTVALCPASHVETVLRLVDPRVPNRWGRGLVGSTLMVCAGVQAARPELRVEGWLTPRGQRLLDAVKCLDVETIAASTAGVGVREVFARAPMRGALGQHLRSRLPVPTRLPGEVCIIHGRHDHVVPYAFSTMLSARMRRVGTRARLTSVESDHADIVVVGGDVVREAIRDLVEAGGGARQPQ